MSLNLTLLPLSGPRQLTETRVFCGDRLTFEGVYKIFEQLIDLSEGFKPTITTYPIPPQMWVLTNEDEGTRLTRTDGLGGGLTFVYAQQLKMLKVGDDALPKNKAIMAFINALPDDVPIILLWG